MKCKCGSENGEMKSGVSQKTGKPWTGWKCRDCREMTWVRDNQKVPSSAPQQNLILEEMKRQTQLLAQILSTLKTNKGEAYEPEPEELKPDQTTPF